jgi:hypothetical protein
VESEELDIVEGSAPSKTEKEPTSSFSTGGARNVGELATRDSFAPPFGGKKKKNFG